MGKALAEHLHSLREYSAHVAAGTLSFADALRTVRRRGRYMDGDAESRELTVL